MKYFFHCLVLLVLVSCSGVHVNPRVIQTKNTELLIPEGITVESRTGDIYITSIDGQKIIRVKEDGSQQDFIKRGEHGFGQGVGIKVDAKRNLIWALSNLRGDKSHQAMVHVFDITTGALRTTFNLKDTIYHLFNDLVFDEGGNAFVTATMSGTIFFADMATGTIKEFIKDTLIQYPNGIERKGNMLYIATYSNGIIGYDLMAKKLAPISGFMNKKYAYNLDGLGLYNNRLFGVYNGDSLNKNNGVIEYRLDETGWKINEEKVFTMGHQLLKEPTTLAINGNKLYLLANSHLAAYNANKETVKGIAKQLSPVTVLVYLIE